MTFSSPAHHIDRVTVVGEEGEYVKMFDPRPVGASPALPERLAPTNPVPEIMAALNFGAPSTPHTVALDLLSNLQITTWDGLHDLNFFVFREKDFDGTNRYPGPTIRMPRGCIYHADTNGKGPPPHTIHWHGIEPTPSNDGVGHCSQEIGGYIYQFQPNFIGSYFYHCHRNTMQHFEFGLFGNLFIHPPDAFFASIIGADWQTQTIPAVVTLNDIPVGAGLDGRFRAAANLETLSFLTRAKFPGFVSGDKVFGVAGANDVGIGDPHAFTVPYDVEAMWVLDDRDSRWSDLGSGARDTFPAFDANLVPGDPAALPPVLPILPVVGGPNENVGFHENPGVGGFFAFNDFHADYWFITGVPVPAPRGGDAFINSPFVTLPPVINSGVGITQVSISAQVGQTILVRCLDAAYNSALVTFPVNVVIIAWDGRPLGVPPFGKYNQAFEVPAGTPIMVSTARRFDALIAATRPMNSHAVVTFHETRGGERMVTARIPIVITA